MEKILVGSRAFFEGIEGYKSKDYDYVIIIDNQQELMWRHEYRFRGQCFFEYKKDTPINMISKTIEIGSPLLVGKFLVKDFADSIGAKVKDILPLEPLLDKLDDKHQYEKIIFEAIKKNKSFDITEEQRQEAYKVYLKTRMNE